MKNKLAIGFSAMHDPIKVQISNQGFKADATEVVFFQKCANAITLLRVKDLMSESATQKARQKLYKNIKAHLILKNKL